MTFGRIFIAFLAASIFSRCLSIISNFTPDLTYEKSISIFALFLVAFFFGTAQTTDWATDVAPIVYKHCVFCHRTGGIGQPWHEVVRQKVIDPLGLTHTYGGIVHSPSSSVSTSSFRLAE